MYNEFALKRIDVGMEKYWVLVFEQKYHILPMTKPYKYALKFPQSIFWGLKNSENIKNLAKLIGAWIWPKEKYLDDGFVYRHNLMTNIVLIGDAAKLIWGEDLLALYAANKSLLTEKIWNRPDNLEIKIKSTMRETFDVLHPVWKNNPIVKSAFNS